MHSAPRPNPVAAILAVLRLSGVPSARARSRTRPVRGLASFQKNKNARLTISSRSSSSLRRHSGGTGDCCVRLLESAYRLLLVRSGDTSAPFAISESISRRVKPFSRELERSAPGLLPCPVLSNVLLPMHRSIYRVYPLTAWSTTGKSLADVRASAKAPTKFPTPAAQLNRLRKNSVEELFG